MLPMKRRIRNMILQIPIFFTVFTSASPSSLEVLYESNSPTAPSWSYTLFPSNFPLTWRAAAELCESIPGAVMAKVRNDETVKVMLRFLQLSRHNSPVWIRNRQTITEVLARERSDVPSLSGYLESNQTFSYPDEGKAGLTLRCSLIRPEVGIKDELCNNLSAFGAICIQPSKSPRPYPDVCPVSQNRPWIFLRRYKKLSGKADTYLTSFSMCRGSMKFFEESKCHPKNGWQDVSSCPEEHKSEANVIYKPPPKRWRPLRQAKIKYGFPTSHGPRSILIPLQPASPPIERFKRSDHPDSIDLIERIMRNITAGLKEKHNNNTRNAENSKNISFALNVHSNSSGLDDNTTNFEKTLPYHLQLHNNEASIIDLAENEIPELNEKLRNRSDRIYLLAEEIVKYLNYSSGEDLAYTSSGEYISSTPSSLTNKSMIQSDVKLRGKYGMKIIESTAVNPRHKRINFEKPAGPKISSLRKDDVRIYAALTRSSSVNNTIPLRNVDNSTTGTLFPFSEEIRFDKLNKSKEFQPAIVVNITRKISKDNLFLSQLVDKSESVDITNITTTLLEKEKVQKSLPVTNLTVTNRVTLNDFNDKLPNQIQNSTIKKEKEGFEVLNNPIISQNETSYSKVTLNATELHASPTQTSSNNRALAKKDATTTTTFIDYILGKLLN